MARSITPRPIRPAGCRGDEQGQMMVLTAVLLVISFVALAAMVGRVNQLGSQTASESRKVILDEVGPLADSMNSAIRSLHGGRTGLAVTLINGDEQITSTSSALYPFYPEDVGRHVTGTNIPNGAVITSYQSSTKVSLSSAPTTTGSTTIALDRFTASVATTGVVLSTTPFFVASDVGKAITQVNVAAPLLPAGARITVYTSSTQVTVSPAPSTALASQSFNIGDFALSDTTTPTIETAVIGMLEQMQALLASRGLWLDYELECGAGGTTLAGSTASFRLFDGQVWLKVDSTATFTRSTTTPCTTDIGTNLD